LVQAQLSFNKSLRIAMVTGSESSGIVLLMVMFSVGQFTPPLPPLSSSRFAVHIGQNSGWPCLDYIIGLEHTANIGAHCLLCID
jgi:hypothetical protein